MLLSTSRGIVRYEDSSRELQAVLPEIRETYGISWTPCGRHLLLASTSGKGHALNFDDLAGYARSEVGTVVCDGHHSPGCLSAPHQIHCVDNTYLLIANSGRNSIVKLRLDDWSMTHHRMDDVFWDRFDPSGEPGLHLNSVYRSNNVVYAVAHNFHRGSRIYALSWPDLNVLETWHFAVGGMHNVCILDGRLLTCDSLNGCIVDAYSGETVWSNGAMGMTRGLAASEDRIYVGSSAFAGRDRRANTSGGIWILERATFTALEYVVLPELGGVNEIRITDTADACHHGMPLFHTPVGAPLPTPTAVCPTSHIDRNLQAMHMQGWRIASGAPALNKSEASTIFNAHTTEGLLLVYASAHCQPYLSGTACFDEGIVESHASVVIEYEGPGDTAMIAGMIRKTREGLIACIWRHKKTWECLGSQLLTVRTAQSQTAFRMTLSRRSDHYTLTVDDNVTLSVPATQTPDTPGSVGVRLSGPGVWMQEVTQPALNCPRPSWC